MSPIQQMLLGVGAVATKTYVDDVFNTYLYKGSSSTQSINNGIDLSGEGGLTWIKARNDTVNHFLYDTERGAGKQLHSNTSNDEHTDTNQFSSFNNNGFTLGNNAYTNDSSYNYSSWTFRKAPGFFDVVTYTGNGTTNTQISHSLGSNVGMVMVKNLDAAENWFVWHKGFSTDHLGDPSQGYLRLNTTTHAQEHHSAWGTSAARTSTYFTVGTANETNKSGDDYVAYVFAGGKSTTDKAVDFDGSGDYLSLPSTTDLNLTGDFTIEFWVYPRSQSTSRQTILQTNRSFGAKYAVLQIQNDTQSGLSKKAQLWDYDMNSGYAIAYSNADIEEDEWTHIAFTRESGTIKIWINGKLDKTTTGLSDSIEFGDTSSFIGNHSNSYYLNAKLSNLRIVKGQALYTTNFNVPSDPLTQTSQNAVSSNVKLLCCNGATAAASTVTPVTITANGDPTVTTNSSIFDDTAAHVFGESGSESVIKCGSYKGAGSAGLEVNVGWEPSWLMIKVTSRTGDWYIMDSMRGVVTSGNDEYLKANESDAEGSADVIEFTSTGFKVISTGTHWNNSAETYSFTAIRRSDGYVGKPPELGTDVFAMDTGNASATIPTFDSNFVVDFGIMRSPGVVDNNNTGARLTGTGGMRTNGTNAETDYGSQWAWDSNAGWVANNNYQSSTQSWMWSRRGQGFDVVTYTGDDVTGRQIPHSLNKIPEMMWVKNRDNANENWATYHKGLNGGTNPQFKEVWINNSNAEMDTDVWNDEAPTSTHFSLNSNGRVNDTANNYIAILFASVDGISKVGYYTGTGSTQTITTGFQPRFLMFKKSSGVQRWFVIDTTRGWGSGDDKWLDLADTIAHVSYDFGAPPSTGFTLTNTQSASNENGSSYIYYAHA